MNQYDAVKVITGSALTGALCFLGLLPQETLRFTISSKGDREIGTAVTNPEQKISLRKVLNCYGLVNINLLHRHTLEIDLDETNSRVSIHVSSNNPTDPLILVSSSNSLNTVTDNGNVKYIDPSSNGIFICENSSGPTEEESLTLPEGIEYGTIYVWIADYAFPEEEKYFYDITVEVQ